MASVESAKEETNSEALAQPIRASASSGALPKPANAGDGWSEGKGSGEGDGWTEEGSRSKGEGRSEQEGGTEIKEWARLQALG